MRLVQRYAEALAEKFTRPIPRHDRKARADWIDKPNPADRVDSTMSVRFIAGDDAPSFRMVTCMEAAEVCAAVRDTELDRLRAEIAAQVRVIAEDGPYGFRTLRAFIARHDRLLADRSVVAVLLALADEIETPNRETYPKDTTRAD